MIAKESNSDRRRLRKQSGAHYTPAILAQFLAEKVVRHVTPSRSGRLRILDPACGDGELLKYAAKTLSGEGIEAWEAVGIEADASALVAAKQRLSGLAGSVSLLKGDFLKVASTFDPQQGLWNEVEGSDVPWEGFDLVIANPPYVRTQVLGAAEARRMAARYHLTGRVDLYQAFIRAMGDALRDNGILGLITSNRFMTTLTGKNIRGYLSREFELLEIIDLGDTKLFTAAVLPAVLVARRLRSEEHAVAQRVPFTRVYSCPRTSSGVDTPPRQRSNVVEALIARDNGIIQVPEGRFAVAQGALNLTRGATDVWTLTTADESEFVRRIRAKSACTIEEVGSIHVGVKTTADDVFVRQDWTDLPAAERPEKALLRLLLTHEDAHRWCLPRNHQPRSQILYPHSSVDGKRQVIDLNRFPRARAYLQRHRPRLEGRRYVIEAGRKWYELWVPQNPAAWPEPKIVFPDISPEPRFCLVDQGYVVNGDCYWITLRQNVPRDVLYLILAVGNSRLMARFHDAAFRNRLYSGRRRYIAQYVGKYPLPPMQQSSTQQVCSLARELVSASRECKDVRKLCELAIAVEAAVDAAFGFEPGSDIP